MTARNNLIEVHSTSLKYYGELNQKGYVKLGNKTLFVERKAQFRINCDIPKLNQIVFIVHTSDRGIIYQHIVEHALLCEGCITIRGKLLLHIMSIKNSLLVKSMH